MNTASFEWARRVAESNREAALDAALRLVTSDTELMVDLREMYDDKDALCGDPMPPFNGWLGQMIADLSRETGSDTPTPSDIHKAVRINASGPSIVNAIAEKAERDGFKVYTCCYCEDGSVSASIMLQGGIAYQTAEPVYAICNEMEAAGYTAKIVPCDDMPGPAIVSATINFKECKA